MDEGRKADIKELKRVRKIAPDKSMLGSINKVEKKIRDEQHDGWLKSARASMIREAKRGNMGNVQDVQETMTTKKFKNLGMGTTQFKLNISEERHKEIYGND